MSKRKILAALLASSALASPALAADMTPLLKAPERAAVAPISGYLEMEGGFAWMDNRNGASAPGSLRRSLAIPAPTTSGCSTAPAG